MSALTRLLSRLLALAALLLHAGWDYAADEAMVTTPALGISSAWRAAAIPVGLGLLMLVLLMQLSRLRAKIRPVGRPRRYHRITALPRSRFQ